MINGFINGNALLGLGHKAAELRSVDKDGDGKLSIRERASLRDELKDKVVLVADSDGDGTVNRAEREALREAIQQRHEASEGEDRAVSLSARLMALLRNSTPPSDAQHLVGQQDPKPRQQSPATDQGVDNEGGVVKVDVSA